MFNYLMNLLFLIYFCNLIIYKAIKIGNVYDEISRHPQFWNELRKKFGCECQICHDEITRHPLFCNGDKK